MPPAAFDYSKALNAGIDEVRGELVVVLSAHAIPIGDDWLDRMTRPFADPRVAGVASRQVPWPDAPWHEVHRLRERVRRDGLTRPWTITTVVFSNAASVIRRDAWRDQPFALPAAEDRRLGGRRSLSAGWTIVYEAGAAVSPLAPREPSRARVADDRLPPRPRRDRTPRTRLANRSAKPAALVVRDGRRIIALEDQTAGRKLAHLVELIRLAWYYVIDFSRSGTTAERRRAGSAQLSRPTSSVAWQVPLTAVNDRVLDALDRLHGVAPRGAGAREAARACRSAPGWEAAPEGRSPRHRRS